MEEELNILIDEYRKYIDLINGDNEFDVFANFYKDATLDIIKLWINKKITKTSIKSAKKAEKFREDGNSHFKTGCWIPAILNYTKSIIYAPFDSLEYNLSMGNRSAALYHLGKYQACVQDLQLCLETLHYPENKKYKLYVRLIQSFIDLNEPLKAEQTYQKLKGYLVTLNGMEEFNQEKIFKLTESSENLHELIKLMDIKPKETEIKDPEDICEMSELVAIKFDPMKGRYIEATSDIKAGDILFAEKTLCFVPVLQEESAKSYKTICYHCFCETYSAIPCNNCDELYCSLTCKNKSWTCYHQFECAASCSQIWKNIGVNFLAFRIFIFGFKQRLLQFEITPGCVEIFQKTHEQNENTNWYKRVCSLLTNIQKMKPIELLPHLVSVLILVQYLTEKTQFLDVLLKEHRNKGEGEIITEVGGILLKHILQVICNASIIEHVTDEFYERFNTSDLEIKESGMVAQGTGLFPFVSLMNHSCDSNVTNYFIGNTIIVKANRNIVKREEVLNCYGHDCRSESTTERKTSLKFQYYFDCCCDACTEPSRPEMYENGMCCPKCNNCSLHETDRLKCLECNHEFQIDTSVLTISDKLYKKWQITKNIKYLEQCHEIETKIYYKYNYKLYDLIQDLQNYYRNAEHFQDWWKYSEILLDLDKKIYGCCSLKYGLNLRQTLIGLLRYLSRKFLPKTLQSELLVKADEMLRLSKDIFKLYYPENKLKFDFVESKLQKIK